MGLFSWAKRLSSGRDAAPAVDAPAAQPEVDAGQRGIALLQAGKFLGACDAFKAAIAQHPDVAANHVNLAYALQQVNAETQAVPHLRQAVALDPASFDAQYMLGGALERLPDLTGAADHLRQALALRPDFEPAHADLCRVLALAGDTVAARAAIDAAIALNPHSADFHHYLGNLCMSEGDPAAAIESYGRALALRPDYAQVHANQGLALQAQGKIDAAIESLQRALAIEPASGELHTKLGLARKAQGRLAEAVAALERAIELRPDDADTLNHLGIALQEQVQLDRAIAAYRRAIALRPKLPGAYANLGLALDEKGDVEQAVQAYRQGLAIEPLATIHDNLAIALQKQGLVDEAIAHYEQALALQPDNLNTRCNLASALGDAGDPLRTIATYREILALQPQHLTAHTNLLFNLSVYGEGGPAEYLAEARRFDAKLTREPLVPAPAAGSREGRKLRVGFVSGDLRAHPVGFFIEGILKQLDRNKLELFAYPTVAKEDELTVRLRPLFSRWQLLKGLSDEAAARAIRADGIDILLDLSGHSGDNRLPVFAYKPAPVQVSWLGYFASTGVTAMDYVLADEACVPPGNEHQFSERIWRVPQTRLCFTPPAAGSAPDVAPLPALTRGHITFGCFQRLTKINDGVLALWRQVFDALPDARLLLQSHQTGRQVYVDQILARLAAVGIAPDRVSVRAPAHRSLYLQSYAEVDMVLDTFPFTGGTTTCEALWMGVPTLTLTGDTMIARQGVAMMGAAGLPDWVAEDTAAFVRKAVEFAADPAALARLRTSLREHLRGTPLFDVSRFARRLEDALEGMWKEQAGLQGAQPAVSGHNFLTQSVAHGSVQTR